MWILLGLISAFTDAFANVLAKYNTKTFDPMVVAWAWTAYSLIILISPTQNPDARKKKG